MLHRFLTGAVLATAAPLPAAQPLLVAPEPVVATGSMTLPADTPVDFEILDPLGSKRSHSGDSFRFRLIGPVTVDNRIVIQEGTIGTGEVVHAARARAMGKAGELILAARHLDIAGTRVTLRGFRFGQRGGSEVGGAFALAVVGGPLAFLVVGGEIVVPPGMIGHARTREAIVIPPPAP